MLRFLRNREGVGFGVLALFTSVGTLLCCALPIVLVTLGLGSVVAALTLQVPFLVTLSEYKLAMFVVSGLFLALAAWFVWRPQACPADPGLAARCAAANVWGKRVLWVAAGLWLTGFAAAYLLLPLRVWLNL